MSIHITAPVLAQLNLMLVSLYEEGLSEAESEASQILDLCYVGPSDTVENVYTFHPNQAVLRQRPRGSDEFITNGVKSYEYRVKNDRRYYAIEVLKDDISDDKVGQYSTIFSDMGRAVALAPSQKIEALVQAGTASDSLGYDGVPFFSALHPLKPKEDPSTVQSNNIQLAGGLTMANFETAYAKMETFLDETGKNAGSRPTILAVPPQLRGQATDIVITKTLPYGGDNKWAGMGIRLMVVHNWSNDPTTWYLFDLRQKRRRPFIYQEREAFTLESAIDPSNPDVFKLLKYLYKVEGRDGAGYGYWQKALRCYV